MLKTNTILSVLMGIAGLVSATAHADETKAPAEASGQGSLNDAQIIQILLTVNNSEVADAKAARSRAKDPVVLGYAEQIIKDYSKASAKLQATGVSKKASSTLSKRLKSESKEKRQLLGKNVGESFDQLFLKQQIEKHQNAISLIDESLLPQAQNANLKAEISEIREMTKSHLTYAKGLVK